VDGEAAAKELAARAIGLWPSEWEWDRQSTLYRDADLQQAGDAEVSTRAGNKRPHNWVAALRRYELFRMQHLRNPREKTRNAATLPDEERRLGEWARYQRRFDDNLCRYQLLRLDVSPAFAWDPQEESWQRNLLACARHRRVTGVLPRLNSADPLELSLARWLNRQLRRQQTGTLPPSRAKRLDALLTDRID
jgi:hypothetical protein